MIMRLCAALFLLSFLFMAGGCEHKGPEALSFAVGGAPNEIAFWENLVHDFEAKSGIRVRILRQPTDTDMRRQGLVIPLRAGQTDPDVFLMDVAWLAQFAASGWLEPLDTYVERDDLHLGVFFRRIIELSDRYGASLVGLPVYVDAGMLYYRKDLLKRFGFHGPPQTWDELLRMSQTVQQKMREKNPAFVGFVWQGAQYEGLICNFLEVALSNGGGLQIDSDGIRVNTPANREALDFMYGLIHESRISPPNTFTEMKEEEVRSMFQKGLALFERNWPYAWPLHNADESPVRGKVAIAPLPHFNGGESAATLGGWHIGISRNSDMKKEGWTFVKYVMSRQTQKRMVMELGWSSARRDIYNDPEILEARPHIREFRAVVEHAVARPMLPYYTRLSEVLQQYINSALAGQNTPAEALARSEEELRRIAARYDDN